MNFYVWFSTLKKPLFFSFLLLLSILLVSCETVSYYSQAARGQLAINLGRENIQLLIQDENLSHELRSKFIEIDKIRDFSETQLGLPLGENYSTYVELDREYVVWNVFAAPEFSTEPFNWCYPLAGCVSYRGYFSEKSAMRYAEKLKENGLDVYVGGVAAYSTLGWFEDSLLSSVLSRSINQIASLIFHELAHQIIYVPGDTEFNESFATTVEREGLRRWMRASGQRNDVNQEEENISRHRQFVELVIAYQERFDNIYKKDIADHIKREEKTKLQSSLRHDFSLIENSWGEYGLYGTWFSAGLNNAQLSTVASYNSLVPFFNEILNESGDDLSVFYAKVAELAELDEVERDRRLERN